MSIYRTGLCGHPVEIGSECEECLEAIRDAEIDALRQVANKATDLYNVLAAHWGNHFERVKADWPEIPALSTALDKLRETVKK